MRVSASRSSYAVLVLYLIGIDEPTQFLHLRYKPLQAVKIQRDFLTNWEKALCDYAYPVESNYKSALLWAKIRQILLLAIILASLVGLYSKLIM